MAYSTKLKLLLLVLLKNVLGRRTGSQTALMRERLLHCLLRRLGFGGKSIGPVIKGTKCNQQYRQLSVMQKTVTAAAAGPSHHRFIAARKRCRLTVPSDSRRHGSRDDSLTKIPDSKATASSANMFEPSVQSCSVESQTGREPQLDGPQIMPVKLPPSSKSSRRPTHPVPRHKRETHISAEYRRRDKIQRGFDLVRNLVPALQETSLSVKESKVSMLKKSADYMRELMQDCQKQQIETAAMKEEVARLHEELELYQQQLPSDGVHVLGRSSCQAQRRLENYLHNSTLENWRFGVFSHVVRPLFESYNTHVSIATFDEFIRAIAEWSDGHLNLVTLRPIILSMLRGISKRTSIMSDPERLEQEVRNMAMINDA